MEAERERERELKNVKECKVVNEENVSLNFCTMYQ
jgi:hypothetical protein